jgi:hypothetical protein
MTYFTTLFSLTTFFLEGRFERFKNSEEFGNLFVAPDAAELFLSNEQAGADPAFALVAAVPAFDVPAEDMLPFSYVSILLRRRRPRFFGPVGANWVGIWVGAPDS